MLQKIFRLQLFTYKLDYVFRGISFSTNLFRSNGNGSELANKYNFLPSLQALLPLCEIYCLAGNRFNKKICVRKERKRSFPIISFFLMACFFSTYRTNKPCTKQHPKNEAQNKENENSLEEKHYETNLFGNIN